MSPRAQLVKKGASIFETVQYLIAESRRRETGGTTEHARVSRSRQQVA